jgi:hypothetical protein
MSVPKWREQIGDPTLDDGFLYRPVHNSHRIDMGGDSMPKKSGEAKQLTPEPDNHRRTPKPR